MATKTQLKNKIEELEFWLQHNPGHPDQSKIIADKRKLEEELIIKESEDDE